MTTIRNKPFNCYVSSIFKQIHQSTERISNISNSESDMDEEDDGHKMYAKLPSYTSVLKCTVL